MKGRSFWLWWASGLTVWSSILCISAMFMQDLNGVWIGFFSAAITMTIVFTEMI